jgi:hypothetical protein
MQPEALSTAGMLQSMSPGGGTVIPHSMSIIPSSPCLPPSGSNTGGGSKNKASRSSSGGSRKRHSPTPSMGAGGGGGSAKRPNQCLLVAAEAITLKDAGIWERERESERERERELLC